MHQSILIIDFGSQFTQLIARRVRELNVYCEIHPFNHVPDVHEGIRGIILSGGPASVRDEQAPVIDTLALRGTIPVLGVCYGAQLMALQAGGKVQPSKTREYGRAMLTVKDSASALLEGVSAESQVWMSHSDSITDVPDQFKVIASTDDVRVAAYQVEGEQTFGMQFHPEVVHSVEGKQLISNFVLGVCGCNGDWTPGSFVEETVSSLREQLKDDHVILGLSG